MEDHKKQTVETYDSTASQMAAKFNGIGARIKDIKRGFSYVLRDQPFVLEMGCGNGRDAEEIIKQTPNYLGVDISKSMIALAKESVPQGRFEVADVDVWAFPTGIDLIFSFASLLHSDPVSVKAVLKRASAALNSEGVFYISLKYGEGKHSKTDEFGTRTYFLYTPEDIILYAGDDYSVLFEDIQELRGQKWFTIVLRKKH
ncbi:class I SAM-dependent methyltransferase [Patescibacteria group bacterium]|nr:class I SAM-dependent methyltransferase [Patescibacteria group bacterium]MBU1029419.1 class I SAM-dependent methyltransferase [Patescibacteria group bacterium]